MTGKRFNIKAISSRCGILPHTLRAWEQRYGVFDPERTPGGQRIYSEDDLDKAILLARLTERGHSISSLSSQSIDDLENMLSDTSTEVSNRLDNSASTRRLLKYLSDYKIDLVSRELQHLRQSIGVNEFIFNIILPTMREVGLLVSKGKYSVTKEHIISTIIRDQLSQIYLPNLGDESKEAALATPDGNLHELSIIFADILCRDNRISTRYLGASHPAECLGEALNALKSPMLILGVLSSDLWNYEKKMIPYLKKIDKFLNYDLEVVLGGAMPLEFPEFKNIKKVRVMPTFEDFDGFLKKL